MDAAPNQFADTMNYIVIVVAVVLIVIAIVRRANKALTLSRQKRQGPDRPVGRVPAPAKVAPQDRQIVVAPQPSPRMPRDLYHWPLNATPFNLPSVFRVMARDLYGTKDVQDAICASYVWMADQMGHILLGLAPTLLFCWAWPFIHGRLWGAADQHVPLYGFVVSMVIVWLYWVYKEYQDFRESEQNWVNANAVFDFDRADLIWNVKTALAFFATGGLIAGSVFVGGLLYLIICVIVLAVIDIWIVIWWLRRKIAFQQGGLPFLFRLANSSAKFKAQEDKGAIVSIARAPDASPAGATNDHVLVTGRPGSGRTSLACGVGTEFAFQLGICRYLSLVDLVEVAPSGTIVPQYLDCDDGRLLWPLNVCELLIVDDIDAIQPPSNPPRQPPVPCVTTPEAFQSAFGEPGALSWLAKKRTMWVIGDSGASITEWQRAISRLLTPVGQSPVAVTLVAI